MNHKNLIIDLMYKRLNRCQSQGLQKNPPVEKLFDFFRNEKIFLRVSVLYKVCCLTLSTWSL